MRFFLLLFISLGILTPNFSQNLIQNGSFENHSPLNCLSCHLQPNNFSYTMRPWSNLATGSPLICDCDYEKNQTEKNTLQCLFNKVQPYEGCTMMEMKYTANCWDPKFLTRGCSNYLGTELRTPMEVGNVYEVSFWLHIMEPDDPSYAPHIGMMLYPGAILNPSQMMLVGDQFKIDTVVLNEWYRVKWTVKPICELQYLVLGVFRGRDSLPVHSKPNDNIFYIDQVEVQQLPVNSTEYGDYLTYNFCKPKIASNDNLAIQIKGVTAYFESNASNLSNEEQIKLDSFAQRVRQQSEAIFSISGHTDNLGEQNFQLSKDRVEAVLSYLKGVHRIPRFRFLSEYYGANRPIATNSLAAGRQKNRRVEIEQVPYKRSGVFYRNAILALEAGETNKAYQIISAWLQVAADDRKLLFLFDTRMDKLKDHPQYDKLEERVIQSYTVFENPRTAFYLDSLWAEDQRFRTLAPIIENLNTYLADFDGEDPKWVVNFEENPAQSELEDSLRLELIKPLLAKNGWPKVSQIGERPAKAVYLILTHSENISFMAATLPQLEQRCLEGEAEWEWYAILYDRLQVTKGKPQRYGTQYRQTKTGEYERFPLEDPTQVNVWRTEIGLNPISLTKN